MIIIIITIVDASTSALGRGTSANVNPLIAAAARLDLHRHGRGLIKVSNSVSIEIGSWAIGNPLNDSEQQVNAQLVARFMFGFARMPC